MTMKKLILSFSILMRLYVFSIGHKITYKWFHLTGSILFLKSTTAAVITIFEVNLTDQSCIKNIVFKQILYTQSVVAEDNTLL